MSHNPFEELYHQFDVPVTAYDCGLLCAPHNPSGKPFCCDICHAVPAAYDLEWDYLQKHTDLWHMYRGDECPDDPCDPEAVLIETPEHMQLLACKGPALCQRNFRAISCRQFPFLPYITAAGSFIGLTYERTFENNCWVISHLEEVTHAFRQEFVQVFDLLFARWEHDLESYATFSEQLRTDFAGRRRRIPILHRNGQNYLLSPGTEKLYRVEPDTFHMFGVYKSA
jgi:hypothetical protein